MADPYYGRPEVSNSDLSALKELLHPRPEIGDKYKAYAFGTLIDAMITEPHKVNYFKRTVDDYTYSEEDMAKAALMKKSCMKDPFAAMMIKNAEFQATSIQYDFPIEHCGFEFTLNVRCKWDLLVSAWKMGGDIKSTAAKTQKQFEEACEHFDYFRSRAWYMDIGRTDKDMLIGISKENFKVFKIPINRGDKLYNHGKSQYQELSFKWWCLFGS